MQHITTKIALIAGLSLVACERRDSPTTFHDDTPVRPNDTPVRPNADKTSHDELESLGKGGGPAAGDHIKKNITTDGDRVKGRDRLAAGRCDHYRTCGSIAPGKKYDSYESCVTREKADLDKDWKLDDCGHIDTPRLDACLSAVNAQKCDALFASSPSECALSKVCIK